MVSQEQKDKLQQQEVTTNEKERVQDKNEASQEIVGDESGVKETEVYVDIPAASGKKRKKRKFRERLVYESEISPKPSIWPLALAFAIALLLFGLIYNVYFLGIGGVLVIVCILGWILERQKA
ncbi:MAG: hypothetical protein NVS4B11_12550 [Ktedonobacteraceae bacterium]